MIDAACLRSARPENCAHVRVLLRQEGPHIDTDGKNLAGSDLSPERLTLARPLGVYGSLVAHDLNDPIPADAGSFAAVVCIGSLGPGHAPPRCLREFARVTRPGGKIIFNVRFDTCEAQGLKAVIDEELARGAWTLEEETAPIRPYLLAEPDLRARLMVFSVA